MAFCDLFVNFSPLVCKMFQNWQKKADSGIKIVFLFFFAQHQEAAIFHTPPIP